VPQVTRVAVLRAPTVPGSTQFGAIQSVAPTFRVEVRAIYAEKGDEIERAVTAFARAPHSGLIATIAGIASNSIPDDVIPAMAARLHLPAVYFDRRFVEAGGLISYGAVTTDQYRQAAGYVDRILKGEKPADLPVQAPTRYETVLNLKAAKVIGLQVPDIVLVRADKVIE
jgi:putative tryptophan/tyrosine transport system substrate-binding protein